MCAAGGLQPFPPINIAPDISPDMVPPMAKKVRSEADDLIPEQRFIAEHPVRPLYYSIICTLLCVVYNIELEAFEGETVSSFQSISCRESVCGFMIPL